MAFLRPSWGVEEGQIFLKNTEISNSVVAEERSYLSCGIKAQFRKLCITARLLVASRCFHTELLAFTSSLKTVLRRPGCI